MIAYERLASGWNIPDVDLAPPHTLSEKANPFLHPVPSPYTQEKLVNSINMLRRSDRCLLGAGAVF
jgi:hypothetical protein